VTAQGRPASRAIGVGRTRVPLGLAYGLMIAFLYMPILVLFVFSFSTNRSLKFPVEGFTLDWYGAVFVNAQLLNAARNSLVVGILAATVSTTLGLSVGLAVVRFRFVGRRLLLGLAAAPLVIPFVVLAVGLFLLFNLLDVPRSLLTIAAGHSIVALPYATLILLSRLIGMDPALEDAAMDLGATYPGTLRRIVLPLLGPSLLSAWLTCFIVSFDEIALANFLAGRDATFPVFLYGQLRFAQQLPVLIAMAVLLMVGTVTLTLVAYAIRSKTETESG
jgi:spermidine/putrescine transport system permease protein